MVTFIGPFSLFTFGGFTFHKGEPREVPAEVIEAMRGHPWFIVPDKVKRNGRKS